MSFCHFGGGLSRSKRIIVTLLGATLMSFFSADMLKIWEEAIDQEILCLCPTEKKPCSPSARPPHTNELYSSLIPFLISYPSHLVTAPSAPPTNSKAVTPPPPLTPVSRSGHEKNKRKTKKITRVALFKGNGKERGGGGGSRSDISKR